ncbi:DUF3102 domain-containing protein [Achromobacter xylosoxidans]|uniref:DUF3102 domain-containing protein n=1 Tax=Alcaligenes xylosoxydans xylosoxydans TaxID=85698 RepID=UPI000B496071|nr:DUF3102 domain-containing protein [Achromobacter xylosoxidans]
MARSKNTAFPEIADTPIGGDVITQAQAETAERCALVLKQFGDGLPFDLVRYEHVVRSHLARSAEEALAAGRALIVVREHVAHGEWRGFLDRIGLEPRLAQRMAQASFKFSNASTSTHLIEAAGSKSKLFELMVLDDEDVQALNDGGTVAGLELDDISRLSVSELRKALRDAREEHKAKDQLLTDKNTKLDKLEGEVVAAKRRLEKMNADEVADQLRREVSAETLTVEQTIRQTIRDGVSKLMDHGRDTGANHAAFLAGVLSQVRQSLDEIAAEFAISQTVAARPEWASAEA